MDFNSLGFVVVSKGLLKNNWLYIISTGNYFKYKIVMSAS